MSSPHAKLYGVKKKCNVDDRAFKAILLGETGKESAKGISWAAVERCVSVMEKDYGPKDAPDPKKDPDWREPAKTGQARKIYVLWGILRKADVVTARHPDGYVKRMTGRERAEWLTPAQCNPVIEGLTDWIKREGLERELR
jgi:hypothetical protein